MKKVYFIIILFLTLTVSGQNYIFRFDSNIVFLKTKDLVTISYTQGLVAALDRTRRFPIYYIDKPTSRLLLKQVLINKPSQKIEGFLVDYALNQNDVEIGDILCTYYDRKKSEIKRFTPNSDGNLPIIPDNVLLALIYRQTSKTETLLSNYYQLWVEKSAIYKNDYLRGKLEKEYFKKIKLISAFEDCNLNCYKILLALQKMNSRLVYPEKLENHRKYLAYRFKGEVHLDKSSDGRYYNSQHLFKKLTLKKEYNTIGDINIKDESELQKLVEGYDISHSWRFIIYNDKIGYLDFGYTSSPTAGEGFVYILTNCGRGICVQG